MRRAVRRQGGAAGNGMKLALVTWIIVSVANAMIWFALKKHRRPTGGPGTSREPRALEHVFSEFYRPEGRSLLGVARLAAVAELAATIWLLFVVAL